VHLVEADYQEIRSLIAGKDGPSAGELEQRAHYRATHGANDAPAFLGPGPEPPSLDGLRLVVARAMVAIGTALDAPFVSSEAESDSNDNHRSGNRPSDDPIHHHHQAPPSSANSVVGTIGTMHVSCDSDLGPRTQAHGT
jgi:hypothetical protein